MEKIDLQAGMLVKSLKGHDLKRCYVIVGVISEDFVLVADGKVRTLENPKMKRQKHVKAVLEKEKPIFLTASSLTDCKIKRFIKQSIKGK